MTIAINIEYCISSKSPDFIPNTLAIVPKVKPVLVCYGEVGVK